MISVIVPVYNVEPYLGICLDSIVNQTYRDLEILVIDDGSTDGCDVICDEYKERDERIRVFHTENRGLSAARNRGLKEANGEWIGFVDSDDWIESDMYETLVKKAEKSGADIVECGIFREYSDRTEENTKRTLDLTGVEAIHALLQGEIFNTVWNKLWHRKTLENIRFPEGRVYEDIATTYRILIGSNRVCSVAESKYHHRRRPGSISNSRSLKCFADNWFSNKERYEFLQKIIDEKEKWKILEWCALAAVRTQILFYDSALGDRNAFCDTIKEIDTFTNQRIPCFGYREWRLRLRIGVAFIHLKQFLLSPSVWLMCNICRSLSIIEI